MPKATAAASSNSWLSPFSTRSTAPSMYGMSTRLTRKPGADLTTTGLLPMASAKLAPLPMASSVLNLDRITSTSGSCATGLKKCRPMSRAGSFSASAMRSSSIEEVLVAMMAPGFILSSRPENIFCLTSSFSTTASMITSARDTPVPCGSAVSLSMAASTSRFFL
ncbi:hypothetical protein D3C86_1753070 [compost metagenome]